MLLRPAHTRGAAAVPAAAGPRARLRRLRLIPTTTTTRAVSSSSSFSYSRHPNRSRTRRAVATTQTTETTKTTPMTTTTLSPADLAALLPPAAADDRGATATMTTTTTPMTTAATDDAKKKDPQLFDFERTWYPLAILETLKTDRPNALTLIGKNVVVWRPLTAAPQQQAPAGGAAAETDAAGQRVKVTRRFADGSWDDPSADGWVVQADLCPHRLAPLSEGRLEADGTVQCAYHGWRFDAGGRTTLIPQLEQVDPAAHARACSHPKSRVALHPCRAFAGVLWVWGEAGGADAALRAATTPPTCVPRAMMPPPAEAESEAATTPGAAPSAAASAAASWRRLRSAGSGWYSRDVPVTFDVLLENLVDPSHVPFSHHRVIGDRTADQSSTMRLVPSDVARDWRGGGGVYCSDGDQGPPGGGGSGSSGGASPSSSSPISRDGGYSFEVRPAGLAPYILHFRPPGHAWFYFPPQKKEEPAQQQQQQQLQQQQAGGKSEEAPRDDDPERVSMLLFATPTRAGWSRVFVSMISPEGHVPSTPPLAALPPIAQALLAALDKIPALQHALNRNAILDGDDLFLAAQARVLYAAPGDDHTSWRDKYYLPASTDVGVAALRRWIDVHGRGMPFLPQRAAPAGGGPASPSAAPPPPLPPPELSRAETFDRYSQHTKDCPHCSAALRNCERALWVLAVLGAACAGACAFGAAAAAFGLVASPARAWAVSSGAAAAAALCALAARAVWTLRGLFVYYDYQHADH